MSDDHEDRDSLEPGATLIWFGKHKGERLDKLPDDYRWWLAPYAGRRRHPNGTTTFGDVHARYLDWLDERRSPYSERVWFGKWEDHEVRIILDKTWRRRWYLSECKWRRALKEIDRRYVAWRKKHPRKRHAARTPSLRLNPVGEKLRPRDDCPASDQDEDYEYDDFVVPDDDDIGEEVDDAFDTTWEYSEPEDPPTDEEDAQRHPETPGRGDDQDSDNSEDSDDDAPLESPSKKPRTDVKGKRAAKYSSARGASSAEEEDVDDVAMEVTPRKLRSARKTIVETSSDSDYVSGSPTTSRSVKKGSRKTREWSIDSDRDIARQLREQGRLE
ncbi:hypothetical protein F4778DRAFT_785294 [Xylariomycetidae sp. FL2044]|nr:hypothetical protein F4778DRAFT_785294 [Xylariomycetidae sp. FL2044]